MVLDHVTERARLLVVAPAPVDARRFRDGDLNVIDRVAAPGPLDHRVREPEGEDVLHRLLAEIVVNPGPAPRRRPCARSPPSSRALARSCPIGFSRTIRAFSARSLSPIRWTIVGNTEGGVPQKNSRRPSASSSASSTSRRSRSAPNASGWSSGAETYDRPCANACHLPSSTRWRENSSAARRACSRNAASSSRLPPEPTIAQRSGMRPSHARS